MEQNQLIEYWYNKTLSEIVRLGLNSKVLHLSCTENNTVYIEVITTDRRFGISVGKNEFSWFAVVRTSEINIDASGDLGTLQLREVLSILFQGNKKC